MKRSAVDRAEAAARKAERNGRRSSPRIDQVTPEASGQPTPEPATVSLARVRPVPIHWLVPDYLPIGKLVLLAGDGGHGKSMITLHIAAKTSTGQPCLGLQYDPPPPADVLLISCEDDFADTVVPRLLAAGADLERFFMVDGIRGPDGKPIPFCLAHYKE